MSQKERQSNIKKKAEEKIFHIRLRPTTNEVHLDRNSNFERIIEQEYATKYLESLKIEATQKNIAMILKNYPLKDCKITAGWNTTGLYADTITIIANPSKVQKKEKKLSLDSEQVSNKLDLKKMSLGGLKDTQQGQQFTDDHKTEVEQQKEIIEKEEEKKVKFKLDFNIESIKVKYLFPFNQTYQRRQNQAMQNNETLEFQQNDPTQDEHDRFLVIESKIFALPFVHIEISTELLKDVQRPPTIVSDEILRVLKQVDKGFPRDIFPIKNQTLKEQKGYVCFTQDEINQVFGMLQSPEMVKLIGVFMHLSYWLIFGVTQPIQVQSITKKQMFISMFEIVHYFKVQFNQMLWMHLAMPMILITLKMVTEFLIKNHYPLFFEQPRSQNNTHATIAIDKMLYLADRIFDQNNLFCRFIFLESDFSKQKKTGQDSKFMHKRIFGVSPYFDIMVSNPENGRTRAIIAKQRDIDIRDKILQIGEKKPKVSMPPLLAMTGKDQKAIMEQGQKQKMLNLVFHKMDNELKTHNIIQLK